MLVVLNDFEHRVTVQLRAHSAQFLDAVFDQCAVVHVVVTGFLFALVDGVDCGLQHFFHAMTVKGCHGNHPGAQQSAHHFDVQMVAAFLQLVPHVQCNHHGNVHVHDLGGQVQIAFQIAGINDVQDGVGMVVADVGAHIHLLGRILGQRVGAGQVHQLNLAAAYVEPSFFAVNGHTAVVAHFLLGSSHIIEQGRLAAVGIAH